MFEKIANASNISIHTPAMGVIVGRPCEAALGRDFNTRSHYGSDWLVVFCNLAAYFNTHFRYGSDFGIYYILKKSIFQYTLHYGSD